MLSFLRSSLSPRGASTTQPDPVIEKFISFYQVPVSGLLQVYAHGKPVQESQLLIRLQYPDSCDEQEISQWIQNYFAKYEDDIRDGKIDKLNGKEAFLLAYAQYRKLGVQQNQGMAIKLLNRASHLGEAVADLFLGDLYYETNSPTHYPTAHNYYNQARLKGSPRAFVNLALFEPSRDRTLNLYKIAIGMNDIHARYCLADALCGLKPDTAAMNLYQEAAASGDVQAIVRLGVIHDLKDQTEKAACYFRHAAERGCMHAKAHLRNLLQKHGKNPAVCYQAALALRSSIGIHNIVTALRHDPDCHEPKTTLIPVFTLPPCPAKLKSLRRLSILYRLLFEVAHLPAELMLLAMCFLTGNKETAVQLQQALHPEIQAKKRVQAIEKNLRRLSMLSDTESAFFRRQMRIIKKAGDYGISYLEAEDRLSRHPK